jgi:hypothetical protein
VRTRLESLRRTLRPSLGVLRALLIHAGELEQAAHDALPPLLGPDAEAVVERLHAATGFAAGAFHIAWVKGGEGQRLTAIDVRAPLACMAHELEIAGAPEAVTVTVRTPEGFAFYALYPEQYCEAARAWLRDRADVADRAALVVGLRSIGTTLAAAVGATLSASGWEVRTLTVRPKGPPFARTVDPRETRVGRADWALIVDEGPGLSGSSMAAVAMALERAGMPRDRMSLGPGHAGEPGSSASSEVRAIWAALGRYVVPLESVRFEGRTLEESLVIAVPGEANDPPACARDLGAGRWREVVFPRASSWPAVWPTFERAKRLLTLRGGKRVLFKFAGLAVGPDGRSRDEAIVERLVARAGAADGARPLGAALGFVATEWVEGVPLDRHDASPGVAEALGRYVARVSGPAPGACARAEALERLRAMDYWNTLEALGPAAAARALAFAVRAVAQASGEAMPAYGDGRLAPHEWLRTRSGALCKVDNAGHDDDHTVVGTQGVLWDLAGALVEWDLEPGAAAALLGGFREAGGAPAPPEQLAFYRMAYAAFRAGCCRMAAGGDAAEGERLERAFARYRLALSRALDGAS